MNMRKPLVIEFTGPPNSGKTTLIKLLTENLKSMGYHVEVMQEDAELVPSCIPKKTWARNVWITFGQLQSLITTNYSSSDIILLDRGFYDSMFWAEFLCTQNLCLKQESNSLLNILEEMSKQFEVIPDYLFIIDVSTEVSIKRRLSDVDAGPVTMSTTSFIDLYKAELERFYRKVYTPTFRLDTSDLSTLQMQEKVLDKIVGILKDGN